MFGRLLRLNMFRKDHGSWMVMLFSTILFLFIFSHIYNLCLLIGGNVSCWVYAYWAAQGLPALVFMQLYKQQLQQREISFGNKYSVEPRED
ncbi:hypothetical protein scyTo_0006866 [Scyliorhinus torazame]|uniref:Uncharacterized protein n=1 Tax=Scyliorhinus torazame TaxID=75743 RepID=A0A401NHP9_SCYTO|nr:hypothetical protein [Scyliorhinus torazame]